MHWNSWLVLGLVMGLTACASRRGAENNQTFPGSRVPSAAPVSATLPTSGSTAPAGAGSNSSNASGTIVTPGAPKVGRISLVNGSARYVIVTFSVGQLPVRDARLQVYRDGLKVAELKVADFTRDLNAAADIVAGEC